MSLTYLEVTNEVLRTVNQTPMSEQQFINARSVQDHAKKTVNSVYLDITNSSREWPWLLSDTATDKMSVSVRVPTGSDRVSIPEAYTHVDWDSMYLTDKDLSTSDTRVVSRNLDKIDYDQWVRHFRERDYKEDGQRGSPEFVFMYPMKDTIGLSPVTDKEYTVQFNAWVVPPELVQPTDVIPFPRRWAPVLVAGASTQLALFLNNAQVAGFFKDRYENSLRHMRQELLHEQSTTMRAI